MKNIDFLPDVYRQRRILRHARHCWMAVAMLFGLAIAGAASGQWYFRCSLAAQLQVVEPQLAISQQRQAEITQLEESQKRTEELAALYLYLEHPWPRTQLLAAVARSLPPSIQLTDLRMLEQADSGTVARGEDGDTNRSIGEGEKAEKPEKPDKPERPEKKPPPIIAPSRPPASSPPMNGLRWNQLP